MRTSCGTRARNALRSVWLASIAVALLAPVAAHAATIVVTTTADEFNSNPAACSLREAIWAANHDLVLEAPGCTVGSGTAEITITGTKVCWQIHVAKVGTITASHIH